METGDIINIFVVFKDGTSVDIKKKFKLFERLLMSFDVQYIIIRAFNVFSQDISCEKIFELKPRTEDK